MRSFASTLPLVLLPAALVAQAVPAPVEARVVAAVAQAWRVEPETVRLAWGRIAGQVAEDAELRLVGRGTDGWFAVVFTPGGGAGRVRAGIATRGPVAARPLPVGTRLTDEDVKSEERIEWGPPTPDGPWPAAGWLVRRALAAGEPVGPPAVVAPPVVAAGDPVRLTWRQGSVAVSLDGVALHAAGLGQPLRVRIEGRPSRLEATVTGPGAARLGT